MSSVLDVLRGGASVAGAGFAGYGQDKQAGVLAAIKNREVEQQAKRDATNAAIAGRPRRTYDPSRGVLVNEDTASVEQLPGLPEIDRAPVVPPRVPLTTGVGPDGSPVRVEDKPGVKAYVAPKTADRPNLITAPDPVTGDPSRQPDVAGLKMPAAGDLRGLGSAALRKAIASNQTQSVVIDDALKELDGHPDAVGLSRGAGEFIPFMGKAGDALNQRMDPMGVNARASLANVASLKIHDRSGAAVTVSEFPRLAPFIPNVSDTPQAVRQKLGKLREQIEIETGFLQKGLSPGASGQSPKGGAIPDHSTLSDEEFAKQYKAGAFKRPP